MARWKARVEFLLSVIELLFLSLTVEVRFFGFYKTRHILLSDSANCTVTCSHFDTIPACDERTDRRTDGQTQADGTVVASTALAMQRAVKTVAMSFRNKTEAKTETQSSVLLNLK